jgi:hypothetical protein
MRGLPESVATQRATLVDWAVELANGNPFFLVELASHCRRQNAAASLPRSLRVALERKLDALSPEARLLVQACAVLGQNATLARLEMMLALPPHSTAAGLTELEATGLVASHDGWVGCRHELIAATVVNSLNESVGSYLHRRCATILDKELASTPLASLAWDCAEHWAAAHDRAHALELTGWIVDRLLSLGLPAAAADLCEKAQRYCTTTQQTVQRLRRLGRARRLMHDWDGVIRAFDQRRVLAGKVVGAVEMDPEDTLAVLEARWWRDHDARVLRRSLRSLSASATPALIRLRTAVVALIVADNRCQYRQATTVLSIVESIEPQTLREEIEKLKSLTIYHTSFGDMGVAVSCARRVVEIERASSNVASLTRALRWLAVPLRLSGDTAAAISALREFVRAGVGPNASGRNA